MTKKLLSVIAITLLLCSTIAVSQNLNLGTLSGFAAYSGTGAVSNIGVSVLTGDVGTNVGAVSGFNLPTTLNGSSQNVNALTVQAKIDLLKVYIHLSDLFVTNTTHAAAFGSGETITPGVYSVGGAGSLAGTITLNGQGNPNAAFVIKFEGGFTAAAASNVVLSNGTRSCNVFWIAEGAITIGAGSTTKGTLLAHPGAIMVGANCNLEGRMLSSEGAITFGPGIASLPAGPITIPINCVDTCDNAILGSVANFALFTSVGAVANAATSGIIGDIGSNAGDISGFFSSTVAGSFYNVNAVTAQAKIDLDAAYIQLHNTPNTNTTHTPAFGSGETLNAGVYSIAAAGSLAGTITLDGQGNPNALFIFKFNGAFTTAAQSKVILANGTRRCNVFWIAEGAVSMGTFTFMKGTLIAHNGANTMGANGNLEGRMLSTTGAIGFSTGVIYNKTLCFVEPSTPIIANDDNGTVASGVLGGRAINNVLTNDVLNGSAPLMSKVNILHDSHEFLTLNADGSVDVLPNTPAGTYVFSYQICEKAKPTNCDSATVTVIVPCGQIDAPTVSVIQPSCTIEGGSITITSPTAEGSTFSVNNTTYQYSNNFNALTPGTYTVTVENNGCISSVTIVVINARPEIPVAPTVSVTQPTCSVTTGKITVSAPVGTGLTYSINSINFQSSLIFSNLIAGNYTVTVKNASGCISKGTVAVLIAQQKPTTPVSSLTQPTCSLATGTIKISSPTGTGITYSINNVTYQSATIFTGLIAGNYNLTAKSAGGCVSVISIVTITSQPAAPVCPIVAVTQPTRNCGTGIIKITTPIATGFTYSINSSTYQSGTSFTAVEPGTYNVRVKNANGCISNATVVTITKQNLAKVTPITKSNLSVIVAPNPASFNFGLNINTESNEQLSIRIIDINGRIIDQFTSNPNDTIDFGNNLSKGLYFIEVSQGNDSVVVKAQKS